jgi:hypothetical protein
MLKKIIFGASICIGALTANSQQLKTPAPSPTQSIRQDFGISTIELNYSRPGVKGRQVFGDLVPWGKVWRTGANSATRIKFSDDVSIAGHPLKAGEYAIYTVPNRDEWEIIINKGSANWGTDYKQEDDIFRVKAKAVSLNKPVETFTIQFDNVKPSSTDLTFIWDKTAVSVPISTDIDNKIMSQINELMTNDNRPYFAAAAYYLQNDRDLEQAVKWFDKAIEQNPKAYYIYYQKASALSKLGKKAEAISTAQKSMELATTAKNDDYVELNKKLLDKLK